MKKVLILIIIFGFILRFWGVARLPAGFNPDEASQGYDAYSLLKTGKDMWGDAWPLSFRSFGEYKLPVYTYLTLPFIAVFGLNEFAVRMPSVLVGTLAIIAVYLFVKDFLRGKSSLKIALLSAFLFAISPWSIQISRTALEANLTTFLVPMALWCWLKGLVANDNQTKARRIWWTLSVLLLGINLYTYHAARFFTLLLFPLLAFWTARQLKINYFRLLKQNIGYIFLLSLFCLPIIFLNIGGGSARGMDVAIFNPTDGWKSVSEKRHEAVIGGLPDFIARIVSNKIIYIIEKFGKNYVTYLSPQFLFIEGPRSTTYGMMAGKGVLYWFELPLLLITIYLGIRKPDSRLNFLFSLILIAPLAGALTKGEGFEAQRVTTMLPFVHILCAYGLVGFLTNLKKKFVRIVICLMTMIIFVVFGFFIENYVFHAPKFQAEGMSFGWRQAIQEINGLKGNYDQIIVSRKFSESQIYLAFYTPLRPELVQSASKEWLKYEEQNLPFLDQLSEYHLDKFTIRNLSNDDLLLQNMLLIAKPGDLLPDKFEALTTVFRPAYPEPKQSILIINPSTMDQIK